MAAETELNITVSFPIYVIALASWVGWWLLVLFLGAGLSALPVDLINEFRFRPVPMKQDEFARAKSEMAKQVDKLIQIGKTLLEDRIKADKAGGCKTSSLLIYCYRCRLETPPRCTGTLERVRGQLHHD